MHDQVSSYAQYEILDEILGVVKIDRDMRGVGFYYNSMNEEVNKFIPLE